MFVSCKKESGGESAVLPGREVDPHFVYHSDSSLVFIPNAFTPDADGLNDRFLALGNIQSHRILVFNDRGKLVFFTKEDQGWDGKELSGNKAPQGLYGIKYTVVTSSGETFTKSLTVHLLQYKSQSCLNINKTLYCFGDQFGINVHVPQYYFFISDENICIKN